MIGLIQGVGMISLLLGMAFFLAPQINPANPQTPVPPQQKCTISGTVLSAEDGEPVERVLVRAEHWRHFQGKRRLMPTGFACDGPRRE